MDEPALLLFLALAGLAIVLSGPIALAVIVAQRGRIAALEDRLSRIERLAGRPSPLPSPERETPEAPEPKPQPLWEQPAPPRQAPATVPAVAAAPPASSRPSFEERFGTRWTVWIGGIALALGAILLLRYSLEAGFFGPGMRVLASFALAIGLIAAGEAARRRLRAQKPVPQRWPDIPAMIVAAGTVALFGAIYAAHALYGFIGAEIAFVALGATGIATMVAALLHGPALAGIGLVGALATPILVGSSGGSTWPLTLYLPVVAASAYGFAWSKGWRALAVAAGIGAAAWTLLLALSAGGANEAAAALVHAILQLTLASATFAVLPFRSESEKTRLEEARPDLFAGLILLVATGVALTALALTSAPGFGAVWIAAAAAAILIPAASGFVSRPAGAGLLVSGIAACAVLVLWPPDFGPDWDYLPVWPETREPVLLVGLAVLAGIAACAAGMLRLLGGGRLPEATAHLYAAGATLPPLAILGVTYLRLSQGEIAPSFAAAAGLVALAMTAGAALFRRQFETSPAPALLLGIGAFASAAVASLALGLVFALSGGSLTVAVAMAALGAAAIGRRLDIPALRWCVAGLGLLVAARLAWDPTVVGADLGSTPILNWLLFGYGLPALCFALASLLIRLPDRRADAPVAIAQTLSLLLSAFLVFFEIRHAMNDGDIYAARTSLIEQGLLTLSALGFSAVLVRLDAVRASPVLQVGSLAFAVLALLQGFVGLGVFANPAVTDGAVRGSLVVNDITLAYALPMLAALLLARISRGLRPRWFVNAAGLLGTLLGFVMVSLLIRHGFQGERLGMFRTTSHGEWYAYSAGWLVLGLAFLAYGILRGSLSARLASAALVLLTIVKVFLFDLSELEGPLRALSFLGLGAVLIGIGLVYQRFVFAGRTPEPAAPEG